MRILVFTYLSNRRFFIEDSRENIYSEEGSCFDRLYKLKTTLEQNGRLAMQVHCFPWLNMAAVQQKAPVDSSAIEAIV